MNTNEMQSMPEQLAPSPEFGDLIVTARERVMTAALLVDQSQSRVPMAVPLADMAIQQSQGSDYGLAA